MLLLKLSFKLMGNWIRAEKMGPNVLSYINRTNTSTAMKACLSNQLKSHRSIGIARKHRQNKIYFKALQQKPELHNLFIMSQLNFFGGVEGERLRLQLEKQCHFQC